MVSGPETASREKSPFDEDVVFLAEAQIHSKGDICSGIET
jgi:hypothetical protein